MTTVHVNTCFIDATRLRQVDLACDRARCREQQRGLHVFTADEARSTR